MLHLLWYFWGRYNMRYRECIGKYNLIVSYHLWIQDTFMNDTVSWHIWVQGNPSRRFSFTEYIMLPELKYWFSVYLRHLGQQLLNPQVLSLLNAKRKKRCRSELIKHVNTMGVLTVNVWHTFAIKLQIIIHKSGQLSQIIQEVHDKHAYWAKKNKTLNTVSI